MNTHDVIKDTHDCFFEGGSVNTVVETEGEPRQPGGRHQPISDAPVVAFDFGRTTVRQGSCRNATIQ